MGTDGDEVPVVVEQHRDDSFQFATEADVGRAVRRIVVPHSVDHTEAMTTSSFLGPGQRRLARGDLAVELPQQKLARLPVAQARQHVADGLSSERFGQRWRIDGAVGVFRGDGDWVAHLCHCRLRGERQRRKHQCGEHQRGRASRLRGLGSHSPTPVSAAPDPYWQQHRKCREAYRRLQQKCLNSGGKFDCQEKCRGHRSKCGNSSLHARAGLSRGTQCSGSGGVQ